MNDGAAGFLMTYYRNKVKKFVLMSWEHVGEKLEYVTDNYKA